MLEEGQKAPNFKLNADGGGQASLAGFKGKIIVLYFYPKDDTPGCTTQAVDFSAKKSAFEKCGAVILGVSKDSAARHDTFKQKHGLKIQLGSDEEGKMLADYGVWVKKLNYGREYMGIERSTFLIDTKGVIRKIWRKVKVKGHAEEVLAAIKALQAG